MSMWPGNEARELRKIMVENTASGKGPFAQIG
jgi:hypothetical protein